MSTLLAESVRGRMLSLIYHLGYFIPVRKPSNKAGWEFSMRGESVRTSESHPIRVDLLPEEERRTRGRLGMTFAPGMNAEAMSGRWQRDLAAGMKVLKEQHEIHTLVFLMEEPEYRYYGVPELLEWAGYGGIEILRFSIRDMEVPPKAESEEFDTFVSEVVARLQAGKSGGPLSRRAQPDRRGRGDIEHACTVARF